MSLSNVRLAAVVLAPIVTVMWCCHAFADTVASRLQVFPFPKPVKYSGHNDDYTVRVRVPGGPWQDLFEYKAKVDLNNPQDASMVYFDFDGTVEMAVQKNNGDVRSVRVRPDSRGIKARLDENIAYFTLTQPENLSVEFDGDHLHNLHVFTHAIREDMPAHPPVATDDISDVPVPDLSKPEVYFGPGVYTPSDGAGGTFHIGSNTTVRIDGSAILKGNLVIENAENVHVISDGLFEDQKDLLLVRDSKNVVIDGPIIINQVHGAARCASSQNVQFLNMRIIGAGQWSDGIGNFACQGVTIAGAFIRTSDDNIEVYNHRWDIWGNSRDIIVKDTTLWADIAHNIFMGIHGNTPSAEHPESEVIEHILIDNIDVLDEAERDPEYEGVLGISAGDHNTIRDVTFQNIRIERIEEGKLFNFHVGFNAKYNTSPGNGINDIVLRNVSFTGEGSPSPSVIFGYDANRKVQNVVLENVRIGGHELTLASPELQIGNFASDVNVMHPK